MKRIFHLIFSISLIASCSAQQQISVNNNWYEINSYGKVVAFSKVAKLGRTSVFVVSTDWCLPCKKLKNELLQVHKQYPFVDFYYVDMSSSHSYEELRRTQAYKVWRTIERLEEWPLIYILGPTNNLVKKIYPGQLKEEGFTGTSFDKIVDVLGRLYEYGSGFNPNIHLISNLPSEELAYNSSQTPKPPKPSESSEKPEFHDPPSKSAQFHIVRPGETFHRIAENYGLRKKDLAQLNPEIENISRINVGQKIRIRLDEKP